jgi:hypothetical protein
VNVPGSSLATYGNDPLDVENARLRLAEAMLPVATEDSCDVKEGAFLKLGRSVIDATDRAVNLALRRDFATVRRRIRKKKSRSPVRRGSSLRCTHRNTDRRYTRSNVEDSNGDRSVGLDC